jgi:hypothetical protein
MALTFLQAVARMEGFGVSGALPTRLDNEGDLRYANWETKYGATLDEKGFARFPSPEQGEAALRELLNRAYVGMSFLDALNKYAPPSDGNNVSAYVAGVEKLTGLPRTTILTPEIIG